MTVKQVEGAVRAWTRSGKKRPPAKPEPPDPGADPADAMRTEPIGGVEPADGWRDPGPSEWSLVFDTETTLSIDQELRVLAYQIRESDRLVEAGFAYNPRRLDPRELTSLKRYARANGFVVMPVRRFVTDVFMEVVVNLRGLLVGFNLPWDISRIAAGHGRIGAGRRPGGQVDRSMLGGVSFRFADTDQRVQVKRTHARGAFIRLALAPGLSPEKRSRIDGDDISDHRGYVVDVSTIAGALLGRKLSLKDVGDTLGTEHRKLEVDLGARIGPSLLRYAMTDVWVTWDAFAKLRERYDSLGLRKTPLWRVHSEASIGKAHLREMGLRPWRQAQPDYLDWVIAAILESYYGGRVECGIRGLLVPCVLLDFTAQYPSVSTLMGMWRFHIATGIDAIDESPAIVEKLLRDVTVDDVLRPEFWLGLHALVQIDPTEASLPTRAHLDGSGRARGRSKAEARTRHLSLPTRRDHTPQWWTLADAVASVLRTGHPPRVLRVLRFTPLEPQPDLVPIHLAGLSSASVDPYRDDVIRRMVELRKTIERDAVTAVRAADDRLASELRGAALAIKKSANSISYGVPIEENVTVMAKPSPVTVFRPDGTAFQAVGVHRIEEPGQWFHPLIATLVVAGGRLLLAAADRLVHDIGGTFVYADTDGMAVCATESGGRILALGSAARRAGPIEALSWDQVAAVAERFDTLNPYDPSVISGSILSAVDVGYDPDTGARRQVYAYSIAAKRYALFTLEDGWAIVAVDPKGKPYRSEHGLGHLLSPLGRKKGDWVTQWWEFLVRGDLGLPEPRPPWFDDPAVGALTMTTAADERTFDAFNRYRPYSQRVRPWGFVMTAHVNTLGRGGSGPRVLVAPRQDDPARRISAEWFDRTSTDGRRFEIRTGDPSFVVPGVLTVQSYGDYFEEFRRHPEIKAADAHGEPCHTWTVGQLYRRELHVTGLVRIGKEVGRLATDPASGEASELLAQEYRESVCLACGKVVPFGQKWCSDACRKRAERLAARTDRRCAHCGRPLERAQRRWCSEACRKRAERTGFNLSAQTN